MALDTVVNKFSAGGEIIARMALLLMVVHVCAEVIGRYVLNQPLPMTIEIVAHYYLVAVIFLPMASVELMNDHTKVELLTEMAGPRLAAVAELMSGILSVGILSLLVVATLQEAIAQSRVGAVASGPFFDLLVWPTRWLVPVGLGLFLVALVLRLIGVWRRVCTA